MGKKELLLDDIWNEEKLKDVKDYVIDHSLNQSKERKLKNKLLSM